MSAPAAVGAGADSARRAAASILHEGRFHNPSVPRPLHGPLHAIGTVLRAIGHAVAHVVDQAGRAIPGGAPVAWGILAVLLVLTVVMLVRGSSRRALERARGRPPAGEAGPERAADLERAADRAEREGRFADAVRLRFRAGLARLAEEQRIAAARSTPTAELARSLQSGDFDALAARFDEIVYGAAPADPRDADEARRRWRSVLSASRS